MRVAAKLFWVLLLSFLCQFNPAAAQVAGPRQASNVVLPDAFDGWKESTASILSPLDQPLGRTAPQLLSQAGDLYGAMLHVSDWAYSVYRAGGGETKVTTEEFDAVTHACDRVVSRTLELVERSNTVPLDRDPTEALMAQSWLRRAASGVLLRASKLMELADNAQRAEDYRIRAASIILDKEKYPRWKVMVFEDLEGIRQQVDTRQMAEGLKPYTPDLRHRKFVDDKKTYDSFYPEVRAVCAEVNALEADGTWLQFADNFLRTTESSGIEGMRKLLGTGPDITKNIKLVADEFKGWKMAIPFYFIELKPSNDGYILEVPYLVLVNSRGDWKPVSMTMLLKRNVEGQFVATGRMTTSRTLFPLVRIEDPKNITVGEQRFLQDFLTQLDFQRRMKQQAR